jgi:hypothetical protein
MAYGVKIHERIIIKNSSNVIIFSLLCRVEIYIMFKFTGFIHRIDAK